MPKTGISILFLGKAEHPDCARVLAFCKEHYTNVTHCLGLCSYPLPEAARNWEGDYVISYLSRWVAPEFFAKPRA